MKIWGMQEAQATIIVLEMNDDNQNGMLQIVYFGMFLYKTQIGSLMSPITITIIFLHYEYHVPLCHLILYNEWHIIHR